MVVRKWGSFKESWDIHVDFSSTEYHVEICISMSYWCSITQSQRNFLLLSFAASPCQVHNVEEGTNRAYKARNC